MEGAVVVYEHALSAQLDVVSSLRDACLSEGGSEVVGALYIAKFLRDLVGGDVAAGALVPAVAEATVPPPALKAIVSASAVTSPVKRPSSPLPSSAEPPAKKTRREADEGGHHKRHHHKRHHSKPHKDEDTKKASEGSKDKQHHRRRHTHKEQEKEQEKEKDKEQEKEKEKEEAAHPPTLGDLMRQAGKDETAPTIVVELPPAVDGVLPVGTPSRTDSAQSVASPTGDADDEQVQLGQPPQRTASSWSIASQAGSVGVSSEVESVCGGPDDIKTINDVLSALSPREPPHRNLSASDWSVASQAGSVHTDWSGMPQAGSHTSTSAPCSEDISLESPREFLRPHVATSETTAEGSEDPPTPTPPLPVPDQKEECPYCRTMVQTYQQHKLTCVARRSYYKEAVQEVLCTGCGAPLSKGEVACSICEAAAAPAVVAPPPADGAMFERFREGIPVERHVEGTDVYESCFVGSEATQWIVTDCQQHGTTICRETAVAMGSSWLSAGLFQHVRGEAFMDKEAFYVFMEDTEKALPSTDVEPPVLAIGSPEPLSPRPSVETQLPGVLETCPYCQEECEDYQAHKVTCEKRAKHFQRRSWGGSGGDRVRSGVLRKSSSFAKKKEGIEEALKIPQKDRPRASTGPWPQADPVVDAPEANALDSLAPMRVAMVSKKDRTKALTKLKHVLHEIISTEGSYVSDLDVIIDGYKDPMTPVIGLADSAQIFANIEGIRVMNLQLRDKLDAVEARYPTEDPGTDFLAKADKLSEVFVDMAPFLKMYAGFVSNMDNCIDCLDRVRKRSKVKTILKKQYEIFKFDLLPFLIKPNQRLCKYPLFFRELVKTTMEAGEHIASVHLAHESVGEAVDAVNVKKREAENNWKMVQVSRKLEKVPEELTLLLPSRRYLCEGDFTLKSSVTKETTGGLHYIVCSDILIYGRKGDKNDAYEFLSYSPLDQLRVPSVLAGTHLTMVEVADVHKCSVAALECSSAKDAREFHSCMQSAIAEVLAEPDELRSARRHHSLSTALQFSIITVTVVKAGDVLKTYRHGMRKKAPSMYVAVKMGDHDLFRTDVVNASTEPRWDRSAKLMFIDRDTPKLTFSAWDHHRMSSDILLGTRTIEVASLTGDVSSPVTALDLPVFRPDGSPEPICTLSLEFVVDTRWKR